MSLSAKQRILKLRETEFKLQKLQNDLLTGDEDSSTNMAEFLSHHRELMALPGSNRDSMPFRFSFEAPKRYVEMKQTQKLTLPPKIPAKSVNKLQQYKEQMDVEELEKQNSSSYKVGLAGHRSLALQSLLNELDKQTSKMAVAFPKLGKFTLLNKTPFLRRLQNHNSKRTMNSNGTKTGSTKGAIANKSSTNAQTKSWSKPLIAKSKKVKLVWNNEISETASTATASELILGIDDDKLENKSDNDLIVSRQDSEELRESVAYALGVGKSNLMGVILPSHPPSEKRGPSGWGEKKTTASSSIVVLKCEADENENATISAKEAVTVLRRRKLPERKSPLPKNPSPHERGLIGIEISNFEPQCAFFYRDRNGNYNPHLHHSKNVTESMKNGKLGWNSKRVKNSL